jgi:hypothetical protein
MECEAGDEVQVDFGRGAPIVMSDGRRRITRVFRVVLSLSRKAYSEAITRQTTEAFIRRWRAPSGTSAAWPSGLRRARPLIAVRFRGRGSGES